MQIKVKTFSLFIVFLISFFFVVSQKHLSAQTTTPTVTPTPDNGAQVSDLSNKIKDLEAKVSDLQSQEKSLSSQISVMDNQIKLTEYRIDDTKEQITELTHDIESATERISHLEGSLTNITKTLLNRISATYQLGSVQPLQLLLSSQNFTDFIAKTNYIRIVQAHDKEMMYNTVQAKNDYANQKNIFEDKKKKVLSLQTQLESYTEELDSEKVEKQRLLSETEGSEANYQRILSQTRAQLGEKGWMQEVMRDFLGAGDSYIPPHIINDLKQEVLDLVFEKNLLLLPIHQGITARRIGIEPVNLFFLNRLQPMEKSLLK